MAGFRSAVDHVLEIDGTGGFGQDRAGEGVPLGKARTALHLVALIDVQSRAVGQLVGRQFLAGLIADDDGHRARHGDEAALAVLHHGAVLDLDRTVEV